MERKPEITKHIRQQNITLESREKMSVSGVKNVEEFNETEVCLDTDCGVLHIDGSYLHITKLNLEDGIVLIEGTICGIVYEEEHTEKTSMWARLFR